MLSGLESRLSEIQRKLYLIQEDDPDAPSLDDISGDIDELKETPSLTAPDDDGASTAPSSPYRVWRDNTAKHSVTARFIDSSENIVMLLQENGRKCTVPLDRLSKQDQEWVALSNLRREIKTVSNVLKAFASSSPIVL